MLSKLCDVIYDCVAQRNEAQRSARLVSSVNRVRCAATIVMTYCDACGSHGSASIFYSLLFYSILPLNICTFPLLYCIAVASHKRKCIKSFAQRDEIGRKKTLFYSLPIASLHQQRSTDTTRHKTLERFVGTTLPFPKCVNTLAVVKNPFYSTCANAVQ